LAIWDVFPNYQEAEIVSGQRDYPKI